MNETVRVLQFTIGGPDFTGIASFLYQYYRKMDHNRVRFDFVFCRQNSLKLVKDDPVFADSEFYELNAVNSDNSVNFKLFDERFSRLLRDKHFDILQECSIYIARPLPDAVILKWLSLIHTMRVNIKRIEIC